MFSSNLFKACIIILLALLHAAADTSTTIHHFLGGSTTPDLIVSQDGRGNYRIIGEVVAAATRDNSRYFIIYVKRGHYLENVLIDKNMIKLIGDGFDNTVVKARKSWKGDQSTIETSATVCVIADGFIAIDMGFENYAGAENEQAVALRVYSDKSAFYRCRMVGYQDTLYTHHGFQFYRECEVYGTVDFIFGDGTVIMQKCSIYARKPMSRQQNTLTAQGRTRLHGKTGLAIMDSKITAESNFDPSIKTYLGGPWKEYSRTVFIRCYIDKIIDPAGWLEWNNNKTFALKTLYYGEFQNTGPGSSTAHRVKWPGYRVMTQAEADMFKVDIFIHGNEWLPQTGIPYNQ